MVERGIYGNFKCGTRYTLVYLCCPIFSFRLGYSYDDEDIVAPKLENSILTNNYFCVLYTIVLCTFS